MSPKTLAETVKRLMIYNVKGGVGKTAIALNFALTYGYGIVTNDRASVAVDVLPAGYARILQPDEEIPIFSEETPILYDFGGYPDDRVKNVIDEAKFVLIPVLPSAETCQLTLNFIEEISQYKSISQIIIIVNRATLKQFFDMSKLVYRFFPKMKIFHLNKTAAFARVFAEKKSVHSLAIQYPAFRRFFQPVAQQFNNIQNHICYVWR